MNSKELPRKRLNDRRSNDLPRLRLKKSVKYNRLLRRKRKLKSNSNCNKKLKHSVCCKRHKQDKLSLRQKDFSRKKQPDSEHSRKKLNYVKQKLSMLGQRQNASKRSRPHVKLKSCDCNKKLLLRLNRKRRNCYVNNKKRLLRNLNLIESPRSKLRPELMKVNLHTIEKMILDNSSLLTTTWQICK